MLLWSLSHFKLFNGSLCEVEIQGVAKWGVGWYSWLQLITIWLALKVVIIATASNASSTYAEGSNFTPFDFLCSFLVGQCQSIMLLFLTPCINTATSFPRFLSCNFIIHAYNTPSKSITPKKIIWFQASVLSNESNFDHSRRVTTI